MLDRIDKLEAQMRDVMRRLPTIAVPALTPEALNAPAPPTPFPPPSPFTPAPVAGNAPTGGKEEIENGNRKVNVGRSDNSGWR